ncbi:NADP-dependent oxidoreductase [Sphaerisporangium corydalis]|uniref:NADP-dependent oxidoreductase n=1 Tax=Sphaerisporangium corydalis TaxID=1441875 RepID=A0ABV9EG05_9ACTN|nr:NADP-dependent oxidoreductase [Sphaerisporangium corydalis]
MKAIVIDRFGGPEVLRLSDVPLPDPGPGQIRVQVRAASVVPLDGKIRSGVMEQMFPTPLPAILGREVAGIVDALGDGVTDVAVGDRVFGWSDPPAGSHAEHTLSSRYAVIPEGLDFATAVSLPVSGETATRVLDQLAIGDGETLLIHGASGAVGELAVQLAVARGATVIGTTSAAGAERVRALGAVPTGYGPGLVERVRELAPKGVDAVFDAAGKGALPDSIELRGGTGRIVTIADPAAQGLGVAFSSGPTGPAFDLGTLAKRVVLGELTTTIAATFPFTDAAEAQRLSDGGHAGGKVILVP